MTPCLWQNCGARSNLSQTVQENSERLTSGWQESTKYKAETVRMEQSASIQLHATRNPLQVNVEGEQRTQALHTNLPREAEGTLSEVHTLSKVFK